MSPTVMLSAEPSESNLQAGAEGTVLVTVRNASEAVGQYRLSVEGVDPAWVQIEPEQLGLFPGQRGSARLRVKAPAGAPAATFRLVVRAVDLAGQGGDGEVALSLTVQGAAGEPASQPSPAPGATPSPPPAVAREAPSSPVTPPSATAAGPLSAPPSPGAPPAVTGEVGALQIAGERSNITMLAGDQQRLAITLRNTGGTSLAVDLLARGLPAGWVSLNPPSASLAPGGTATTALLLRPAAEAPMGSYPFTVVVQGRDDPSFSAQLGFVLEIAEAGSVTLQLSPERAEGQVSAEYQVHVSRPGATAVRVVLSVSGKQEGCDFRLDPESLVLPLSGVATSRLTARATHSLAAGEARTFPFTVTATVVEGGSGTSQAQGGFTQRVAPRLELTLAPTQQRGADRANYTLHVSNPSQVETTVRLSASDRESACSFQFTPPEITLAPGAATQATLSVVPLALHDELTERLHPFTVRAEPAATLLALVQVEGQFVQTAIQRPELTLNPASRQGAGATAFSLLVSNPRASPLEIDLAVRDPAPNYAFTIAPQHLRLGPGAQAAARLVVRPTQKLLPGEKQRVAPFVIEARTTDLEPVVVQGSFIHVRRNGIEALLPWLAGGVVVLALVAAALFVRAQRSPMASAGPSPTPQPTIGVFATVTARALVAAATHTAEQLTRAPSPTATSSPTTQPSATAAPATSTPQPTNTPSGQGVIIVPPRLPILLPTRLPVIPIPKLNPTPASPTAFIVCPDANATLTDQIVFRVKAYDPGVGTNDGDGIDYVDMDIYGPTNQLVYQRKESTAGYCAFSGGEPNCELWVFVEHGFKWPNNNAVAPGQHTLKATVHSKKGLTTVVQTNVNIQPVAPKFLVATIVCASQNAPVATTELAFQVQTYDLAAGNKDGDGINRVELRILDSKNQEVFKTTVNKAPFCAFGASGGNCNTLVFAKTGLRWSLNGPQIGNDIYTLRATVYATNSGIPPVPLESKVKVQVK